MNLDLLRYLALPFLNIFARLFFPLIGEHAALTTEIDHVRSLVGERANVTNLVPVLNFIGLVERHGYTAEEHNITTDDGYIITLHRISGSPKSPKAPGKPVVYIQHGILLSSDSWVLIGPGKDLAFILADAGNDVWIGNVRGNRYSRSHVKKDPKSADFWSFGYHEMAIYDVKGMIDFILKNTGAKKLTYYGYSMGTTISYVLLSVYPEYNDKIELLYTLMPVVFWKHELRPTMAALNSVFEPLKKILETFEIHEVMPQTALAAYLGKNFCGDDSPVTQYFCVSVFSGIGLDVERFNKTALPEIMAHFPSGTSTITVFHYNQNYKKDAFQAYDFGTDENMRRYNQPTPVVYNLTKVTAPVSIWYSKADGIVNYEDVFELAKRLPNVKSVEAVDHPNFAHFDLLWSVDAKELLYDKILDHQFRTNNIPVD